MSLKRLLIVDDTTEFGDFARKVGLGLGCDVEVVACGREFMERYEAFKPTVAVIDLFMPGIDGIELVQWVADHHRPCRVIVVTGHLSDYADMAKEIGEAKGLAPIITLSKPMKAATLRDALADCPPSHLKAG